MRIYLRLDRYLDLHDRKFKHLAHKIGITQAQLTHAILKEPKHVSVNVLEKSCEYLVKECLVEAADLPGALFSLLGPLHGNQVHQLVSRKGGVLGPPTVKRRLSLWRDRRLSANAAIERPGLGAQPTEVSEPAPRQVCQRRLDWDP
mgnify:CR=1 FL=1